MNEVIQLATLGRPFQLGMLYDCRSDTLIPGVTLWDLETLKQNLNSSDQPSTEFEVITSDSIEEKANALNMTGSLKASFLSGLVELKGSAKYLNDTKKSKQQARVALLYKTTTRFEQLTMNHLGKQNITYPSVFEDESATHVVTAVLYGAQAFFVFDQTYSSPDDLPAIEYNMGTLIKCLPKFSLQGEMTKEQKHCVEKFSCKFYGDFSLKNNPTTFQDAINIYASLPSLLGSGGKHSVPIIVWLHPLKNLDSKAAQLVREINVQLVNQCQRVLEQLSDAVMRCNDMMNNSVAIQFPDISKRILQFQEMCLEYKMVFQRSLARVVPSIRGGRKEEMILQDILKNMKHSPFSHQSLITWLDGKEQEMMVMKFYLRILEGIPIVKSVTDLNEELMNPAIDYVVCFTFTTVHQEDLFLLEAIKYLQTQTAHKIQTPVPADEACTTQQVEQWFHSQTVSRKMKDKAQLFLDFATTNRTSENVKFLIAAVQDGSNIGASIYLYEGGFLENSCYEPPSQPERPMVSGMTHDSVTLQLHPPRCGAAEIVSYKVEYKGAQQEEWTTLETPDKFCLFTIGRLEPHQEYQFRYRAVTKVGVSKASEYNSIITGPKSPLVFQDYSSTGTLPCGGHEVQVSAECAEPDCSAACDKLSSEIGIVENKIAPKLCNESHISAKGNPSIYKLELQEEVFYQSKKYTKFRLGNPSINCTMKTIMFLGATGSGKSTLINGMINYILGVEWRDNFRFKLISEETGKSQAESQTSYVTAYQIYHQDGFKIDHSLTIIDTPGFGDTRGIEQDQLITEQIREFFTSPGGVDQIDAVCFVAQSSLARLTQTQKYIFDSILSIFGKDIAENIQILVTFADGQRPPILEALKVSDIPCCKDEHGIPKYFKFNNSAIFAQRPLSGKSANEESANGKCDVEEDNDNFEAMFWKMGASSMKKFFRALNTMKARSLSLTKEVLRERKQLEATVKGLKFQIQNRLTKSVELRKTKQVLNQFEKTLEANKDFEYEVDNTVRRKKKTDSYNYNCKKCEFTCHSPCNSTNGLLAYMCTVMDWWGYCKVCPQRCNYTNHINEQYKFYDEIKKEKRTYNNIKEKYEKAYGEKMTVTKIKEKLEHELTEVQDEEQKLIEQISQSIRRLNEIALRPSPVSNMAYIELLIQSEKEEGKPGYKDRIEALRSRKDMAELVQKVAKKEES
ncbi:uncharacterized protein LOC132394782 [Hypanus sabinus]|uniref:uncharacterized protein LOC132394782 n=1 Tax=Hypanus sabinus TaxID=79690 RepID=UPI0028C45B07|nr:uncharacterized protein LOC132394782 [Hypanus sabinus]